MFKELNVLKDNYFIDVSSIDRNFNTDSLMKRRYALGCQVTYDTFQAVNVALASRRLREVSTLCRRPVQALSWYLGLFVT